MKRHLAYIAAAVAVVCCEAGAMPTQRELADAQSMVSELMSPHLTNVKKGTMKPGEAGDKAMEFAAAANTPAAKYLFLKRAVALYARVRDYDKAADAVEAILSEIEDVPPETVCEIVAGAVKNTNAKAAPRLFAIGKRAAAELDLANARRAVVRDLKKNPDDAQLMRRYAELSAAFGDWDRALKAFAKSGGEVGGMAQGEIDGTVAFSARAAFWWSYQPLESITAAAIREYAADLYQSALDAGELEGLEAALAQQRIAQTRPPEEEPRARPVASKPKPAPAAARPAAETKPPPTPQYKFSKAAARKAGLLHRWSFSGNLRDSVGGRDAKAVNGKVSFEDGQVRIKPGSGGYIDLGANIVPGGGDADYTIEVWATKYSIQNWARIFHIPNNWGNNDFFWAWNAGTDDRKWQWKVSGAGIWYRTQGDGTGIGKEGHFVVVYGHDENKKPYYMMHFLRDGREYWGPRGVNPGGSMFKTHLAFWLGHGASGEAQADASYNEVRIWNRALTNEEVLRSSQLGPDKLPID